MHSSYPRKTKTKQKKLLLYSRWLFFFFKHHHLRYFRRCFFYPFLDFSSCSLSLSCPQTKILSAICYRCLLFTGSWMIIVFIYLFLCQHHSICITYTPTCPNNRFLSLSCSANNKVLCAWSSLLLSLLLLLLLILTFSSRVSFRYTRIHIVSSVRFHSLNNRFGTAHTHTHAHIYTLVHNVSLFVLLKTLSLLVFFFFFSLSLLVLLNILFVSLSYHSICVRTKFE